MCATPAYGIKCMVAEFTEAAKKLVICLKIKCFIYITAKKAYAASWHEDLIYLHAIKLISSMLSNQPKQQIQCYDPVEPNW